MTYSSSNDPDQTQVIPDWRTDPRNRVDNGVDAPFHTNSNANGYTARGGAHDDRNHPVRNFFTTGDTKLSPASEAGRKLLPAINDGFAIASMWLGIFGFTVVSIVLGIVSINQAKREGRRVSGMAVAGIIISIVEFVVFIFILILIFAALAAATNSLNSGT
jgi:amino acid transporter